MEFENLQIEVPMQNETDSQLFGVKVYEKKYQNTSKDFVVGFNPHSKEFLDRKSKRAKRFGITESENTEVITTDLQMFKEINLENLTWPVVSDEALEELRPDAILAYGVDNMSTKDVFQYFKTYGPDTLEWINDYSCNVVWEDENCMVRAMDGMSKSYATIKKYHDTLKQSETPTQTTLANVVIKEEESDETLLHQSAIEVEDDIDPKDVWRIGLPYKKQNIFLRPATIKDKKLPGAARRSEYYLKYGKNPNSTQETPGVLSKSRKRKIEEMKRLANERYNNKEPAVKICELSELKDEGFIHKMEIDESGEPSSKKQNVRHNSMTMVADKLELKKRLGSRYDDNTIHNRLGVHPDHWKESTNRENHSGTVHDRLGANVRDRLGRRGNEEDARKEIQSTRKQKNKPRDNPYAYEDEQGVYHDVYQAQHVKIEEEIDTKEIIERYSDDERDDDSTRHRSRYHDERFNNTRRNDEDYNHRADRYSSEHNKRSSSSNRSSHSNTSTLKSRLGQVNEPTVTDLRSKIRKNNKTNREHSNEEPYIKEEEVEPKVNLCIEIKQEPKDDYDVTMDDTGDFEF